MSGANGSLEEYKNPKTIHKNLRKTDVYNLNANYEKEYVNSESLLNFH